MKKFDDNFDEWSDVIPISTLSDALEELPTENLPSILADAIEGSSVATETPKELNFTFAISAIAGAVQGKFYCEVWDGYEEQLAFWSACYCPSGERKTAAFKTFTAPILEWEQVKYDEMKGSIIQAAARLKNQEARIAGLRKKLAAQNDTKALCELEGDILNMERELELVPIPPRVLVEDVTPERLASLLSEQNERLALISDEAGIFGILAGRYSQGAPNLDIFLKGHSGSAFNADRQGRGAVHLKQPLLTVALSPQPSVLEQLGDQKEFRGRGLLARFIHMVPKSKVGFRNNEFTKISPEVFGFYKSTLNHFLNFSSPQPIKIPFSLDSQLLHKETLRQLEVQMRNGGELYSLRDWANKLGGTIARLSTIFTLVDNVYRLNEQLEVTEETYARTAKLLPFLKAHALKAFGLMKQKPDLEGALKIIEWLEQNELVSFSARSCFAAHKHFFETMPRFSESIDILREHNYLKGFIHQPETGRPSQRFRSNPLWIGDGRDHE